MPEIRRILCPTDFSDASRHALDHALMLAAWYRARIVALHVRPPGLLIEPPILWAEFAAPPVPFVEETEARLHEWLQPVRAAGIACEIIAVDGQHPARAIVEAVAQIRADLIVIGTHGRGGFERLLLGSVTERVVRTARCPVITVPPPATATSFLAFRHVLCGIDFSESSLQALRLGLSVARESRAVLTLFHAVEFPTESPAHRLATLPFDIGSFRIAVQADAARRLEDLITDDMRARCEAVAILTEGRAHEEILHAASTGKADLIVLGVHGRRTLDHMLFGSTTNQVIRRATCPVLTLNH